MLKREKEILYLLQNDTMPTAAAPGDGVSVPAILRDVWDALRNGTGGSEPATNKSIVDCIGTDGAISLLNLLLGASGDKSAIKGLKVSKAKSACFDSSQNALFDVTGDVLVLGLKGEVADGAVDTETVNTKFIFNSTTYGDTDLCAVTDLSAAAVGTVLGITGTFTDALVANANGAMKAMDPVELYNGGTIDILSSADGGGDNSATASFEIWYLPLSATGAITAHA